jgi:hypothetical protein
MPRSFLEIKVENFRALSCARSLNGFFQRAFPVRFSRPEALNRLHHHYVRV